MGKTFDGKKYMFLSFDNNLKKKSLEDNLYFTLSDIFWNADNSDTCMMATGYSAWLANNIEYPKRTDSFQYANILHQEDEIIKIIKWLERISPCWFEFSEDDCMDGDKYMLFDDWWTQFEELRSMLKEQHIKIKT